MMEIIKMKTNKIKNNKKECMDCKSTNLKYEMVGYIKWLVCQDCKSKNWRWRVK